MNVAIIIPKPEKLYPKIINVATTLIDNGHKVVVISWDKNNSYQKYQQVDGILNIRLQNINSAYAWFKYGPEKILNLNKQIKIDLVYCVNLVTLSVGVKIKKKLNIPLVYDTHDISYFTAKNSKKLRFNNIFSQSIIYKGESYLLKHIDYLIAADEPMLNFYSKIYSGKVEVIRHSRKLLIDEYKETNNDKFTICYFGSIAEHRFLKELVEVTKNIKDVRVLVAGRNDSQYSDELIDMVKKSKHSDYLGFISDSDVLFKTLQSDVVFCMVDPNAPNASQAFANKQFEAMICGRPIICSWDTYSGEITHKHSVGLLSHYEKQDLKNTIITLRDNKMLCRELGMNALDMAKKEYNWSIDEKKLLEVFNDIL